MAMTDSPTKPISLLPLYATADHEIRAAPRALRPDAADTVAEDLLLQGDAREQLNVAAARRDSTFRRLLGVADLLAAGAALVATGAIFVDTSMPLFAALIVLVPVAKMYGLYDRDEYVLNKTTLDEVPTLLTVALVFVLSAFAARDVLVSDEALIGAGQLVVMATLTLTFLTAGRVIARRVGRIVTTPERCLLIGEDEACGRLAGELATSPSLKVVVAGRVRLGADAEGTADPELLIHVGSLRQVVRKRRIDRLILVPDGCSSEAVPELIRAVKSVGVKVSLVSRMHDAVGSAMEFDDIGGRQLMGVRAMKMSASSSFLKRLMDLAGAGFGLLMASPVFAVAALAIKLDSHGPVLYRQPRIGLNGESFKMIKFRSMRVGADAERDGLMQLNETTGLFKIADDPRITRVGRLLRRCALDELPQLLNVLRGEMSLVGPRPLVPDEDENITGWYRRRSRIKPGITGIWQLLGPVRIPLDEMVKLDYLYMTHWSLWLDTKILLRTIPYVLRRRGL